MSLLRHWNQAYNLVAAADLNSLLVRHVLDSLSILPFIYGSSLLDVGTGAGFPGVPLAIMNPQLECTLLDSSGKKIRFLRHVKRTLKQNNIHPVQSRVEAFEAPGKFDTITSRAFASLADFAAGVQHLAGSGTRLLAMKGKSPEGEMEVLPPWLKVESVEKISVPGLRAERHLVIMSALK
jgi:16S rRNA (guanine527-N7)-methyltransferase